MKKTNETRVMTLVNNKGGVGKTSSCTAIASLLGLMGYKILVVDNDSQTNATSTLLDDNARCSIKKSVADLYRMSEPSAEEVEPIILKTPYSNVDIIPSSADHQSTEGLLFLQDGSNAAQMRLTKALETVKDKYDYVLIDTHPSFNSVTQNALCASDYVLTPVRADGYSLQGTMPIANAVLEIASNRDMNPNLQFVGVFITSSEPRTNKFKMFREYYQEQLRDDFIPISIRQDAAVDAVTSWLIPLPYLLGGRDFRSTAKWKAVYDYLDLMYYVEMITEEDYLSVRTAFEMLDGNLLTTLKAGKRLTIASIHLAHGVRDEILDDSDKPFYAYKDLIKKVNSNSELRAAVQKCISDVVDPDRLLKLTPGYNKANCIKAVALKQKRGE